MPSITIPVWNVTNFLYTQNRGADHFGPFTSQDAAKAFVSAQVSEDVKLDWQPSGPDSQSLTAQLTGERWRITPSQLVVGGEDTPEFDVAILRVARQIMRNRFGLFTKDLQQGLYGAEQHLDEQISKSLSAAEPGSDR